MAFSKQKKILLEVDEDVARVVKKLQDVKDKEVVLVIPRESVLGNSLDNFQLLRRRSQALKKKILIESVDDHILEVAELVGFLAVNPVFRTKGRPVADILPIRPLKLGGSSKSDDLDEKDELEEDDNEDESEVYKEVKNRSVRKKSINGEARRPSRIVISIGFMVSLVGLSYWLVTGVLPKATIRLVLKNYPVDIDERVRVGVNVPKAEQSGELILVPGELLSSLKNIEMNFPASGKEARELYAEGRLVVYNGFSSEPQVLIARTRFLAPDGKVFRLKDRVTLSGAKIVNGKSQASQTEVLVVADRPGPEYNIGPVGNWRIPGFRGTPRFEAFYAESEDSMRGGAEGYSAVPTESDIAEAKKKTRESLVAVLKNEVAVLMSDSYEVLPGTTVFEIKKEDVYPTPDSETNFSVFMEAGLRQFVFEKEVMREILIERQKEKLFIEKGEETIISGSGGGDNFKLSKIAYEYVNPTVDFEKGEVSFTAKGSAVFETKIEPSQLVGQLVGLSGERVKEAIYKIPGLERANVSLWPFWVKSVPKNPEKVEVILK